MKANEVETDISANRISLPAWQTIAGFLAVLATSLTFGAKVLNAVNDVSTDIQLLSQRMEQIEENEAAITKHGERLDQHDRALDRLILLQENQRQQPFDGSGDE